MQRNDSASIPVRTIVAPYTVFDKSQSLPFLLTMEDTIRLSKSHGVYLSVSHQHQRSEASQAVIMKFLTDMIALDATLPHEKSTANNRVPGSGHIFGGDENDVNDDDENDDNDNDDKIDSPPQDEDECRVGGESERKLSIPGKRGFPYNPVCIHCKMQFDHDFNDRGACVCHPGKSAKEIFGTRSTSHAYLHVETESGHGS